VAKHKLLNSLHKLPFGAKAAAVMDIGPKSSQPFKKAPKETDRQLEGRNGITVSSLACNNSFEEA
jgi:hypothetical protein